MPACASSATTSVSVYNAQFVVSADAHGAGYNRTRREWQRAREEMKGKLWLKHVQGHSGQQWNDGTDVLADEGWRGRACCGSATRRSHQNCAQASASEAPRARRRRPLSTGLFLSQPRAQGPRGPVGKPKPPPSHGHRTASCSARSCGRRSASGVPGSSRRPHRQVRIGYHPVAAAIASSPRPPRAVYASRKRASSTTADLAGAACSECCGRVGIRHAMTNDASVAIGRWDRQRQLAVGSGLSLHR